MAAQHFMRELESLYFALGEHGYNAASVTVWGTFDPIVSRVMIFHPALSKERLAAFSAWMREALADQPVEQPEDQPVGQMTLEHKTGAIRFEAADAHFQALKTVLSSVFELGTPTMLN